MTHAQKHGRHAALLYSTYSNRFCVPLRAALPSTITFARKQCPAMDPQPAHVNQSINRSTNRHGTLTLLGHLRYDERTEQRRSKARDSAGLHSLDRRGYAVAKSARSGCCATGLWSDGPTPSCFGTSQCTVRPRLISIRTAPVPPPQAVVLHP